MMSASNNTLGASAPGELWRRIPQHPRYEVSNYGRVRSLARNGLCYLKPEIANGYPRVALGRKHRHKYVHRLVALAFLGSCPAGQEVRHKNGIRTDVRADNLEYGTRADNVRDAIAHGTFTQLAAMIAARRKRAA